MRQLTLALLVFAVTACDDGGGGSEQDVAGDTRADAVEDLAVDQAEVDTAGEDTAGELDQVEPAPAIEVCVGAACGTDLDVTIAAGGDVEIVIRSVGDAAATVSTVALTFEPPENWTAETDDGTAPPWTMEPGTDHTVRVMFEPVTAGAASAAVEVLAVGDVPGATVRISPQ